MKHTIRHHFEVFAVVWNDEGNIAQHHVVQLAEGSTEPNEDDIRYITEWVAEALKQGAKKVVVSQRPVDAVIEVEL